MTITMTAKNQITIPRRIADVLHLEKGSIFNIEIFKNRIELIPFEVKEKEFTPDMYRKLDALSMEEKGREKRVTKRFVDNLKKGGI